MNPPLRLYFSDPALDDVFQITHESEFPVPASWLDDLQGVVDRLTEFPAMGRRRTEFRVGLRSFAVGSFIVFY